VNAESKHPEDLLPWYVNNTLSADERVQVETHMVECEDCRNEVKFLQKLRAGIQQDSVSVPEELGLKRLLRDVKKEKRKRVAAPAWMRLALAASVAIIVLQSIVMFNQAPDIDVIKPLGSINAGVVLQVQFAPGTTEKQIRQTLQEINGEIIGGPGAFGLYHIQLNLDENDTKQIEEVVAKLSTRKFITGLVTRE